MPPSLFLPSGSAGLFSECLSLALFLAEQTSFHGGATASATSVNIFRDFPHRVKMAVMETSLAERSPPVNDLVFTFLSQ